MFRTLSAAALAALVALPALAADVEVQDAYARSSNPKVGGAFMVLINNGDTPVKLVEVRSDVAKAVELHTHVMEDGIAKMRPVEAIEIPAHGEHRLQRGGDHVMMMGLTAPLAQGDAVLATLVFDDGDELAIEIPVDNVRQDMGGMDHSGQGMSGMDHNGQGMKPKN